MAAAEAAPAAKASGTSAAVASSKPSVPAKPAVKASKRRLRRGQRNEDLEAAISDVDSLPADSTSPFYLSELIAARIRHDPHDVKAIIALPSSLAKGKGVAESDDAGDGVNKDAWLYEQLRRVCEDLTAPLLLSLQDRCTRATCPEMKAGEWLYLCAAHATTNEQECAAIDYATHTLDGATALLNSSRYFPSRLSINAASVKHFTSIARRLYRIFAHTYFQHRDIFDETEAETSLYSRFVALSTEYGLITDDLLVIEADKLAVAEEAPSERRGTVLLERKQPQ